MTIGFWSVGRLPARLVAPYIASQIAGAVLASFALWLLLPEHRGLMGAHVPAIPAAPSVVMEVILTFFLMFVILGVIGFLNAAPGAERINRQPSSGLAVGAVVALAIWFAGPTSGASMNPARSLAPALFAGEPLQYMWIYVIGPVGGALLAGLVGRLIRHTSRSRFLTIADPLSGALASSCRRLRRPARPAWRRRAPPGWRGSIPRRPLPR